MGFKEALRRGRLRELRFDGLRHAFGSGMAAAGTRQRRSRADGPRRGRPARSGGRCRPADIVPCKIVDEIWHQHILDTAAFREDCDAIFGRFLDHFPYFGMRDEQDAQALNDAYADTTERYRHAFGEPPAETWISPEASSRCKRTACKPRKCR